MRKLCELFMMYWLHAWRQERRLRWAVRPGTQAPQSLTLNLWGLVERLQGSICFKKVVVQILDSNQEDDAEIYSS
jgi:hypothetical protein